jgi:hypothetical protein
MKKNKLIELLQAIEGNPDIYFWNGYVEDYMDINPNFQESLLVKQSKEHLHKHIRFEYMRDVSRFELTQEEEDKLLAESLDAWNKHYNEWTFPNPFVEPEQFNKWYDKKKKIYLLSPKPRGKSSWDRMGDMEY